MGMDSEETVGAEFLAGAVGRIDSCEMAKLGTGVAVGDFEEEVEALCPECGLSGRAARAAARTSLQHSGGRTVDGA